MKRLYVSMVISLSIGISSANTISSDSLTLSDAVRAVLKNSISLLSAQDAESAASARTSAERSALYPLVTANASYANVGPASKFSLPLAIPPSTTPTMQTFQLSPDNVYEIHAGVDYTLYDFGKRNKAVKISQTGGDAASLKTSILRNSSAYQAAVLFSTLLIQQQAIKEKEVDSTLLEKHIDFVKRKLETGSATQFDVLRAQVQLTSTKTDLNNLINDFLKTKIEFQQLAGLNPISNLNLKGSFDSTYHSLSSDSLISSAINERQDMKAITIALKSIALQKELSKLDMRPVLVARGTAGYKDGFTPDLNKPEFNWTAGLAIQMPIFNGYKSAFRTKEIEARLDSTEHVLEDSKRKIKIDILKAVQDVNGAYDNLQIAIENEHLASEAFRLATLQYETGTVTNLDVLDAETKFSQAKFARYQSQYRCTMCKYGLWQSIGFDFSKLSEEK